MQQYLSEKIFVQIKKPRTKQATALLAVFLLTASYILPLVAADSPLTQPTLRVDNDLINRGQTAHITMSTSPTGGSGPYNYEWTAWLGDSPTHPVLPGQTGNTCEFSPTTETAFGNWGVSVHVTDSEGQSVYSAPVNIAVVPEGTQRLVGATISPKTTTLYSGQSVTISMITEPSGGVGPYHYQWNGWKGTSPTSGIDTRIDGATDTSYTFTAPATYGIYQFTLASMDTIGLGTWNNQGPSTVYVIPSSTTLLEAPTITSSRFIVEPTQTASFTMTTLPDHGVTPYSYQWIKWQDWQPTITIDGATSISYDFTADSSSPQGNWHFALQVTDANGITVQSQSANIKVVPAGYTSLQPSTISASALTVDLGDTIHFSTTQAYSGGIAPYTMQWNRWRPAPGSGPMAITGATTDSLDFTFNDASDYGMWSFCLNVKDGFNDNMGSNIINIQVLPDGYTQMMGPTVTPATSTLNPGETATFSVSVSPSDGLPPYHYQWNQWMGMNPPPNTDTHIEGATGTSYTFTAPSTYGTYKIMLNTMDSIGMGVGPSQGPSTVYVIPEHTTLLQAPIITSSQFIVEPTQTASFTMTTLPAQGITPYSYQWYKWRDWQPMVKIDGATGTSYDFTPDSSTSQGMWHFAVEVTDANGILVQSQPANIKVVPTGYTPLTPATISASATSVVRGQQIHFSVTQPAQGGVAPYTLSWNKWQPGSPSLKIEGETGDSLDFTFDSSVSYGSWWFNLIVRDSLGDNLGSNVINVQVLPSDYTPITGCTMNVSPNIIHPGQSTTITATDASGGYGTLTYTWQKWLGNNPSTPHETLSGVTGTSYTFITTADTPVGLYHFARIARDELGFTRWPQSGDAQVMVVPESYTQLNGVVLTTTKDTLNPGQTATLSALIPATGGQTPYTYQWQCAHGNNNFQNIEGATNPTYDFTATSSTATGTYRFQLIVTDSIGASAWPQQGPVNVDVVPAGTPDLIAPTITASALFLHRGETSHLTVSTAVQGGQGPYQLQWIKWQGFSGPQPIAGATTSAYDFTVGMSSPYGWWNFQLQATDSLGCVVWSQQVNILIAPDGYVPLVGAIVSASPNQITPGQTIHLSTATAPTGGLHTTYQWMKMQNGQPWTEIPGATTLNYDYVTDPSMAYGTWQFALVATDDYMRQWPIQGPANVLVVPSGYTPITGAIVTATPTQVNPGQTIHLTITTAPHGGHGTLTYQWMKWQDGSPTTEIPGATTLNYDYVTDSSMAYGYWHFALVAKDDYAEQWPSGGPANVLVVPSGYVTLTGAVVAASPNQVQRGQTIHLSTTTAPTGGQHTTYQWMMWKGNSPPTAIPGATGLSYDYTIESSIEYGYWQFALVAKDDYMEQWPTKGSATVLIVPTDYQQLIGAEISATPYRIMPGQTIELRMTKAPSGGYGGYSYQWYQWLNNGQQTPIEGADTPNFDYVTSDLMDYGYWNFVLVVKDSLGTQVWPYTGSRSVAVAPEDYVLMQTPTVYSNASSIHAGDIARLQTTIPISGGQTPYHYQWYTLQSSGWVPIAGAIHSTYDFIADSSTSLGDHQFILQVVDDMGFNVNAGTTVQVLPNGVDPLVAPVIVASPTSIQPGGTVHLSISQLPTGGVGPYTYQWYVSVPNSGQTTPIEPASSTTANYATTSTSPTGTYLFVLIVQDSQGATKQSTPITVQVLNEGTTALSVPGVQVDKLKIDMLDTIELTLSGSVSGGDNKYTYIWIALCQDNGQMYAIAQQVADTIDYTFDGHLAPGNYKFALIVRDESGHTAIGDTSPNVIVSAFVTPEAPWGTTIVAIFAAACVLGIVQQRRNRKQ